MESKRKAFNVQIRQRRKGISRNKAIMVLKLQDVDFYTEQPLYELKIEFNPDNENPFSYTRFTSADVKKPSHCHWFVKAFCKAHNINVTPKLMKEVHNWVWGKDGT